MSDDLFYREREPEPPKDTQNGQSHQENPYQGNPYQGNPYQSSSPQGNPYYQNNWNNDMYPPPANQANGVAIASLVAGIISLCCCFCPYISPLCGLAGIIMAALSKKGNPMSGIAIAGMVVSIIGFIIGGLFLIYVIYIAMHPELYEQLMQQYYDILESAESNQFIIRSFLLR